MPYRGYLPRILASAATLWVALLAVPSLATPRESPWSASILAGPVGEYPDGGDFDNEFAIRAGASRKVVGPWDATIEAGYTRFGLYYYHFNSEYSPPSAVPGGKFLDSFDVSLGARWHPNIQAAHPYISVGAGAHAVHQYLPEANLGMSRQIRPGVYAGMGLHGIILPALGFEFRWLTIFETEDNRNRDLLSILFTLTRE